MSGSGGLFAAWHVSVGPLVLTDVVIVTWVIMSVIAALSWLVTRRLRAEPGRWQTVLEGAYEAMFGAVAEVVPKRAPMIFPFIASLWIFVLVANLAGIIPGVRAPTSSLSTTAGLALLVFLSVHWYGIRVQGLRRYLAHYLDPNPLLLPFTVLAEITRTLAMAIRLFGNMMSLGLTAALILMVAGFLAPIPILMLHIVEALVQAYIFGMLALIYIAGGLEVQELQTQKE